MGKIFVWVVMWSIRVFVGLISGAIIGDLFGLAFGVPAGCYIGLKKSWWVWLERLLSPIPTAVTSSIKSTVVEIRQMEPYLTATSSNPPKALSKCIELRARAETGRSILGINPTIILEEHLNHTYHIALTTFCQIVCNIATELVSMY